MDYKKFGKGFQEEAWNRQKKRKNNEQAGISERVIHNFNKNHEETDFDTFLAELGLSITHNYSEYAINWELVARMAASDESIHVFAKWIRGFEVNEMAEIFCLSRTRIFQLLQAFLIKFKDPQQHITDPWFRQICFAFGISEHLGLKYRDESEVYKIPIGWKDRPVDLDSTKPLRIKVETQLSFFGD